MTDKTELKRMADDLNSAIGKAEHKPGQWSETAQSMGGICCPGEPFDISKPWAKEEPWARFSFKRDSWLAVAAVNALPQMMALIAEIEALRKDAESRIEWAKEASAEVDRLQGIEAENERLHTKLEQTRVIGRISCNFDAYEKVLEERDLLKAENEVLRKSAPSTEIIWCACGDGHAANSYGAGFMDANGGACANCDAANQGVELDLDTLRRDAERYRWLRGQHWNESEMAVVCYPKKSVKLGFDCPSDERLDDAIDAALGKGEQS